MTIKDFVHIIDVPLACSFLFVGIVLSFMTKFPQFRHVKLLFKTLRMKKSEESTQNTMSPLHALYTAMSTSLGMGNIMSPAVAVAIGGPGALFWLIVYALFGSVTKFCEVFFAVTYKRYAHDGSIIGGPAGYLYQVHPFLAAWYATFSIILFSSWSALQSKTLAITYARYGIEEQLCGGVLAAFILLMLISGTKTIGKFASKIVPLLFICYLAAAFIILFGNIPALLKGIKLIFSSAFTGTGAIKGFIGASAALALREGIFKAAFTTEAGVGTAAIPHAYADTNNPLQQATLGMYSIFVNTFLCTVSGLVALTTDVWQTGKTSNDLTLDAFTKALPTFGPIALTATITICIIGATLGNSFNGSRSFGYLTKNRWMKVYYGAVSFMIFGASILDIPTLWGLADLILPLIAVPNMVGLLILTHKHKKKLQA